MPETLFISDLHLSPERPEKLALFKRLLQGRARRAKSLYILGDLFENFWAGNDDQTPPNPEIIAELKAFTESGAQLFFMRGNRELMLDRGFETLTGCTVLTDGSVVKLNGENVLLMHGDALCTRDISYQRYRRFMESTVVYHLYRRFPHALRILLAHGLRPFMKKSAGKKPMTIIDAEQSTIEQQMLSHEVQILIHGHTHRPGMHDFALHGSPARRIVLGDWYVQDSVLVCDEKGKRQLRVEDYLAFHEDPGLPIN